MTENVRGRSSETKFGRVPLWLYDTGVGLQAIATYGWLHGRYGHYERVMPSYGTLAKELGVSRGSVIAYVKALTSVGAVRIETSGAAGRQTNVYAIAFTEPFPVGGQNADQGVSGVGYPSQPTGRGGQPVVQKEDVSSKTFLEDEKLSLPSEPDPVHEREMLSSFEDPDQPEPVRDADPATQVTAAWVEAYKRSSNGSEPSAKAVTRVRTSAGSRLRAGKTAEELALIAADMAETNLAWTDLAEHEAHWLHRQQQWGGLAGTDATVAGWLQLADQLGQEGDPASKPSVTDQRVHQALDVGRQLQAEADARRGGYRPQSPNEAWDHIRQQADAGERPDGWEKYPHCGHPDCDEITRMRDTDDGSGQLRPSYCSGCHPVLQWY